MRLPWRPGVAIPLCSVFSISFYLTSCLDIPPEVDQSPSITEQGESPLVAVPFEEGFPMRCEATGKPEPKFRWTRDGMDFDPNLDPRLALEESSGTFVIPNSGNLTEYQGTYQCHASNRLGTALSHEVTFVIPNVPKFPKEKVEPLQVEEGQPFILECNPPRGIPPLQIYWMSLDLQHIEQDERVSMGLNGNLYFSNALPRDSRHDYCCFAAFPRIRTIVQKTAMSVIVNTTRSVSETGSAHAHANSILARQPRLMVPPGVQTYLHLVKGEDLQLECVAEGFPTPKVEWTRLGERLPDRADVENHGKVLMIEKVLEEDEGRYRCRAWNGHGEALHTFHVLVQEPPRWTHRPHSLLSPVGSDVEIKCAAAGNPQPSITWRRNGRPLHEVPASNRRVFDDTIILRQVGTSDSAVYQCEASNTHGTILANANLLVLNMRPLVLMEDGVRYWGVEGRTVLLHCRVFGSPVPTLSWGRSDQATPLEGARFSVQQNGSLEVRGVEKRDAGKYSCSAQNTEGTATISATLEVRDPTRIVAPPRDLRVRVGHPAQFTCIAEFDASFGLEAEVGWEHDGSSLNGSDGLGLLVEEGLLQVLNVSHGDEGVYTCIARSHVDRATASARLTVLDVPDSPQDVLLSEQKGRSVTLEWVPGDEHHSATTEFIVEFEDSQREPGRWRELQRIPGHQNSAVLALNGHVAYRFRVSAINTLGRGQASEPSERYHTPPTAPDRNPEKVAIEGHLPHELLINWEPLSPLEHNAPGVEYKVSYRQRGVAQDWHEHLVKRHSFVVKDTPTFVPYEIKIQSRNQQGWGPDPNVLTAYSGEDFPSVAPDDVGVKVVNSTSVRISWAAPPKDKLHGILGGYRVNWWRLRSLLDSKRAHGERHTLTFLGDRNHAVLPGLRPFSEYSLIVMVFNGRGNGPGSHPVNFKTPEGVPGQMTQFHVSDVQKHTATLSWAPPAQPNGIITRYMLQYQLMNGTEEESPLLEVNVSAGASKWHLQQLQPVSRYRFSLRCCTQAGCGPAASDDATTTTETRVASIHGGISNQGWFIGLMCAMAFLTLIILIACFINRNKGGKYSVKEKEDLHPDLESQGMNEDTFCEYSDNDEKPLRGSKGSLGPLQPGDGGDGGDGGDSLVDYGEEDVQFNEDGSFIGEYAGHRERAAGDSKTSGQATA